MNKQKLYIVISSVVGILATFMPWVNISAFNKGFFNVSGVETNGQVSLVLFVVVLVLCLIGDKSERLSEIFTYTLWGVASFNIVVFFVLLGNANEYGKGVSYFGADVNVSHGAYLSFLAAIAIILFSIEQLHLVEKMENLFKGRTATATDKTMQFEKVVTEGDEAVGQTHETEVATEEQVSKASNVPVVEQSVTSEEVEKVESTQEDAETNVTVE